MSLPLFLITFELNTPGRDYKTFWERYIILAHSKQPNRLVTGSFTTQIKRLPNSPVSRSEVHKNLHAALAHVAPWARTIGRVGHNSEPKRRAKLRIDEALSANDQLPLLTGTRLSSDTRSMSLL
jgi:hypothetical protein